MTTEQIMAIASEAAAAAVATILAQNGTAVPSAAPAPAPVPAPVQTAAPVYNTVITHTIRSTVAQMARKGHTLLLVGNPNWFKSVVPKGDTLSAYTVGQDVTLSLNSGGEIVAVNGASVIPAPVAAPVAAAPVPVAAPVAAPAPVQVAAPAPAPVAAPVAAPGMCPICLGPKHNNEPMTTLVKCSARQFSSGSGLDMGQMLKRQHGAELLTWAIDHAIHETNVYAPNAAGFVTVGGGDLDAIRVVLERGILLVDDAIRANIGAPVAAPVAAPAPVPVQVAAPEAGWHACPGMNGQRVKSGADGFCRKCRPTPPTTPSAAPVQVAPVAVAPVAAYPVYPAPVAAPQGAAAPLAPTVHVDTVPELSTAPVPAPAFKGYPTKGTFTVTIAKTKTDAAKNEKEMVLKIISADFMNRAGEGVWTRVAPGLWQTVCRKYQESDSVQVTVEPFTTPERVLIGRITKIRMVDASPRTDGVKGADSPPAGRKTLKTPERTTTQPTIEATPVMAECDMCDAPIPVNGPTTCASCTAELEATYARLRSMRVSAPKA